MIELYHCVSARSFRPLWAMEEMGLAYTLKMLPFPPRATAKDYLATNPLGTVPALITDGVLMTESAAMCQFLADRHARGTLSLGVDEPDYPLYLNWLHAGEATLTFPQTLLLRYGQFEPAERRQPQVVEDYRRWFLGRLRGVAAALEHRDWLCAGRFTVADISVGYALMLAEHLGMAGDFAEPVQAYWQRLSTRDAFQRCLRIEQQAAADQGVPVTPSPLIGRES